MVIKKNKPELLAPAGNLEKLETALAFGADAVYLGVPDFSLRARINDFDIDAVGAGIRHAHGLGKKVYITLNIFAHGQHIADLPEHVKLIKDLSPDGIIISDPGVWRIVKELFPGARLILSTQANCTNWSAVRFWKDQGAKRVIIGRETPINDATEMKKKVPGIEIETFIHGAMCMSYSGRCFLSKFLSDRSANQGDCAQPCRWPFEVSESLNISPSGRSEIFSLDEDKQGSFILNSLDLCLLRRIPELIAAGFDSFKIEGRAKSVYYLATVVGIYRQAIDLVYAGDMAGFKKRLPVWLEELEEKITNRGYTEGFIFGQGQMAQNIDESHKSCDWEFCGQVVGSDAEKVGKLYHNKIKIHNSLKIGGDIEIVRPGLPILKLTLKTIIHAQTGREIDSAHGGQNTIVIIPHKECWEEYSVIRRKK